MASEEEKRRQQQRFSKQIRHLVDHDEEQRRKRNSKARRGASRDPAPRRRGDWSDDEPGFEKMTRPKLSAVPSGEAALPTADLPRATVASVHRGHVQLADGRNARVATRLLLDPDFALAVGDEVLLAPTDDVARIVALAPRRSRLARPDPGNAHRQLVLAANVDVAVIVVAAADPPLRPGLIDRFLLALAEGGVAPLVAVNKLDLVADEPTRRELDAMLAPYVELAVPVVRCTAIADAGVAELRAAVAGKVCVFVGHSGVGKSSLLNAIDPAGGRRIGAVREHDGRGRHTTTAAQMRTLPDGTRVIDTPGIRAFGLDEMAPEVVRAGFPELAAFARGCRFRDCSHRDEPDCAVRAAAAVGELPAVRYGSYLRILAAE